MKKETPKTISSNNADILNALRNDIGGTYKEQVPFADGTIENMRAIGEIVNSYATIQNQFLSALVNRIGRVMITSKMYSNKLAMFKKGLMEYGETVEEIFVSLAKPFTFNPEEAESTVWKREIPDVRAVFHTMNYKEYYKQTTSDIELRQAFLSSQGVTDLISKIIEAMYTSAEYDEFVMTKYLIARVALNGNIATQKIPVATAENARSIMTTIKAISNNFEFLKTTYNQEKVPNNALKKDQYLIMNSSFDAIMDVEVLALSFNMTKAEFTGHLTTIDSFRPDTYEMARLAQLFAGDDTYVPFTATELGQLDTIPAVLVDKDWFMIFDNYYNMTELYNGQGLYWNHWYHVWKTFSISPFANAVLFSQETASVTSVTISPATASIKKGDTARFVANVTTTGFANESVIWKLATTTKSTVNANGLVTIASDETATTLTLTATSVFDGTKKGTATITVTTA